MRSFGVFMLGATFFGTFVSSFVDAGFVTWIGWKADPYWDVWRLRFFSNMLSTQTIVPAIMATAAVNWRAARKASRSRVMSRRGPSWAHPGDFIAAFTSRPDSWYSGPSVLYAPLPLLVWAALRFGSFGVNVGLLVLTLLAITGAVHGSGPFMNMAQHQNALSVQSFLILVAVPLQLLAKVIGERDLAEEKAYDRQRLLAFTLKAARVGVWDMDLLAGNTSIDEQLAAMFDLPNWERREVASWMMRMHPIDLVESEASMREAQARRAARRDRGTVPSAKRCAGSCIATSAGTGSSRAASCSVARTARRIAPRASASTSPRAGAPPRRCARTRSRWSWRPPPPISASGRSTSARARCG